jgi:hypothetical protein
MPRSATSGFTLLILVIGACASTTKSKFVARLEELQKCRDDLGIECMIPSDAVTLQGALISDLVSYLGRPAFCITGGGAETPVGGACAAGSVWEWSGSEEFTAENTLGGGLFYVCSLNSSGRCAMSVQRGE